MPDELAIGEAGWGLWCSLGLLVQIVQFSGFHMEVTLFPRDIWLCLEMVIRVVSLCEVLLASRGPRPALLLKICSVWDSPPRY